MFIVGYLHSIWKPDGAGLCLDYGVAWIWVGDEYHFNSQQFDLFIFG